MKRVAVTETYEDGQPIIKQGTHGEGTYVILSGSVAIKMKVDAVDLVVATLNKGDIFGHMSFIDKQPRSATAVSIGQTKVGIFDMDYLENEINKTSEDFRMIIKALTERLRETTSKLVSLTAKYYQLTGKTE
ncbi:Crp/Fnr family transcriptional regulator [Candidatus Magnetomonas plexicatena]|uniref:Crp/Fnr family transcriptional regulator n=1 Tax=Candidatus Magnetomonas plexicatena TaxID=2552947 RepID=UPI001C760A43|nr:cyclic nucleotide-binding domain-containing protein [Nitrospirales bacterium LBB_01]